MVTIGSTDMGKELTSRQGEILAFIWRHIADQGFPPTRKEIARAFGFKSDNAAEDHIKALVRKGKLKSIPNISRGLIVL